jgi:aminoglycoside phosphotransferase (APT) family kinase protein
VSDPLTPSQQALILSLFPPGARITRASYFQENRPCPLQVCVRTAEGSPSEVVLRLSRNRGGVETEASMLPILARLGLPVAAVLAGPASDPHQPDEWPVTVLSLLPGETLQSWSERSAAGLEWSIGTVIEAVALLHGVTEALQQSPEAARLPRKTLLSELEFMRMRGGAWVETNLFHEAVRRLQPVLAQIEAPLVFSNGDYQPANFLSDGQKLTGIVDFEKACFEDPLLTFARYPVYDLRPLSRSALLDRYLDSRGLSARDFAPRVALFCLRTLQTKVPVAGGTPEQSARRRHVLALLHGSLALIR